MKITSAAIFNPYLAKEKDRAHYKGYIGHETTANALSWTFYLLSQHPEKMKLLQEEIERVLQRRNPDFQSLKELKYTQMVLEEAMRCVSQIAQTGSGAEHRPRL